jgi:UDP-glucose 4-epimerase
VSASSGLGNVLVTGSAGHLGEGLAWTLTGQGVTVRGLDIKPSRHTTLVGSVFDPKIVDQAMAGIDTVFHTATLHKPHVKTHSQQEFIDTNISGSQTLLNAANMHGAKRFIFTSTTSVFGYAMRPQQGGPAVWVSEDLVPDPRNIYGVTKLAAEGLCRLTHRESGLPCMVLRTSRFFSEDDDSVLVRSQYSSDNSKASEFLYRRVELEDVISAHLCAAAKTEQIGYGLYIISASTPFSQSDLTLLAEHASQVVDRYYPGFREVYAELGWEMFEVLDRVYDNSKAREELEWKPRHDFQAVLDEARRHRHFLRTEVTRYVGVKGYHDRVFEDGPFPV